MILPGKLLHLKPYFPALLPLLTLALRRKGELASAALRTLEGWFEADPDIVNDMTDGQLKEIMRGICLHLQPAPYPYGMMALRVLGKLGGRNRRFLRDVFQHESNFEDINSGTSLATKKMLQMPLKCSGKEFSNSLQGSAPWNVIYIDAFACAKGAYEVLDKMESFSQVDGEVSSLQVGDLNSVRITEDPGPAPSTYTGDSSRLCCELSVGQSKEQFSVMSLSLAVAEIADAHQPRGRGTEDKPRDNSNEELKRSQFSIDKNCSPSIFRSLLLTVISCLHLNKC